MNKLYFRRDFSIPKEKLVPTLEFLNRKLAIQTLFSKMWTECFDIAVKVLETDYFKGILNNNLDPNVYGILMVQDAYYCYKAEDSYIAAATHPLDETFSIFLKAKINSYKKYNETYHQIWRIRESSGVVPNDAIKSYVEHEAYVAGNLDSPYLCAAMLPCEYLWTWVAGQLAKDADINGLYYFWIEGNNYEPSGAYQMANLLEQYRNQIDELKAIEIFRTSMEHELDVFTTATKIDLDYGYKNLLFE